MTVGWLFLLATCCLVRLSSCCVVKSLTQWSFCDTGQYLDTTACVCRNCTFSCPVNQIVRRSCSPVSDSVCGPFFEFQHEGRRGEKNRRNKTPRGQGHGHGQGQGQVHGLLTSRNGPGGEMFSLSIGESTLGGSTVRQLFNDQLKDADAGRGILCRGCLVWIFSAAAIFSVVVMVIAIIVYTMARKKSQTKNTGNWRRLSASTPPGQEIPGVRMVDQALIHIESQLIWNSHRRSNAGRLLGKKYFGNDYVKEYGKKNPGLPLTSSIN